MRIAGWISTGGGEITCQLLAVEHGVAVLELDSEQALPPSFALEIPGNVTVRRSCSLVTQAGRIVRAALNPATRL